MDLGREGIWPRAEKRSKVGLFSSFWLSPKPNSWSITCALLRTEIKYYNDQSYSMGFNLEF